MHSRLNYVHAARRMPAALPFLLGVSRIACPLACSGLQVQLRAAWKMPPLPSLTSLSCRDNCSCWTCHCCSVHINKQCQLGASSTNPDVTGSGATGSDTA